jgi:hypothetical protein
LITSPVLWFGLFIGLVALAAGLGPAEKSLGVNVRIVYLHGAWVWTALIAFAAAGLAGLAALVTRWSRLFAWSAALGRVGLFFWVTYLPISMWAMQANWNGLFLAEPRWRLALIFAVSGLLLQAGLAVLGQPKAVAVGNISFLVVLVSMLRSTQDVLHPASPILSSDSSLIQIYFLTLLGLTLAAGWQQARWWLR